MSSPTAPAPRRRWLLPALLLLALAAGGLIAYLLRPQPQPPQPPAADVQAALEANTRGVGRMERFEYAEAAKEFAEAGRLAPDWLPARVNLGIALFNENTPEAIARAREVFAEVLARDPDSKHAHYCLGVIDSDRGHFPEAFAHFRAVNKLDPNDAHTWFRLGLTHPNGTRSPEARDCFERALALNPYLNAARYNLAQAIRPDDPKRAAALDEEREALRKATWEAETAIVYGVMGKYADVIGHDASLAGKPAVGPLPAFEPVAVKVTLAPGARWATAADLDATGRAARARFGDTVVLFDSNGDGRPDVFLAAAVVENGAVRDLLLRNDGAGEFAEVPLPPGAPSLGAAAGDFDNDGKPDLALAGAGGARLLRNAGDAFADVSAAAGFDKLKGTFLGCGWLDIDQDGDLDLILCEYADAPAALDGPKPGGGVLLFENVGVAPPAKAGAAPPALSVAFKRSDALAGVVPAHSAVSFLASDLDADRDADLLILPEAADPVFVQNDRLMRFTRPMPAPFANQAHRWNGGLVLDANHDERSDLLLLRAGAPPLYLVSRGERDFAPGATNSPALKQAVAADIDMDGWPDAVGLGTDGRPVLLHNRGGGRLEVVTDAFGPVPAAHALAVADFDGDGAPDLLAWTADGLRLFHNAGNGNAALLVSPTGRRDKSSDMRTSADGIGTWLVAQAGSLWTGAERTTTSAGLGQSLLPTALGIGKRGRADALRLRWPDAVIQAELGVPARSVFRVAETNRKGTSCPVLMAWDGEKFAFVTDFLGAGALGESGPGGSVRPPRPEESVKIEPAQLAAKGGQFVIKVAEPMDEVLYLDHLRLDVIDHPAEVHVLPDERFALGPPWPSQKLLAFGERHFPRSAAGHAGRDVLPLLLARDRRAPDGFARRAWLGFAEDHALTLDFGELPAGKWYVVLAGWTEYPYPESMYAAARAGVALAPPVLERATAGGKWVPLCELGFPAGLPRVMSRELPADFRGGRLRIATNMQVFWDQLYVARAEDAGRVSKVTSLGVARADLAARGFMREVYPDGRPPVAYDDSRTEPVAVTKWKGKLTRLGDVTELLRAADDRFVLCGPGDEVTVRFDAKGLPELPAGWERSFVLRTRGYCKDASTTTATGGEVGPLPFAAMPNYPHFGGARPPATDARRWHTR